MKTLPLFLICLFPLQAGIEAHTNTPMAGPASFLLLGAGLLAMYVTTGPKTAA